MGRPVSVRLDEDVQMTLEAAAKTRGIGLSTYLRELAANEAKRVRRERICVFRAKSATNSEANRPLIPTEIGHRFRLNRPPVPKESTA